MPNPESIPVSFSPVDRTTQTFAAGGFTVFGGWHLDPELKVESFPANLPYGLYELTIDTPDAGSILAYAQATVERGGAFGPLRVTVEARDDRLHVYFVLLGDATAMTLTLLGDGKPLLRVGACSLRRISTTRWRLGRGWRGLKRRALSPGVIGRDLMSGWEGLNNGGVLEVQRRILDVINPTSTLPNTMIAMRIGSLIRKVAAQNAEAMTQLDAPVASPASLSIVVPIYRTRERWLLALVDSLNRQTDPTFEVVFVFDGEQPDLSELVSVNAGGAYRSTQVVLPDNRGVSTATNAGMRAASGEYVVVVDHDDVIETHFVEAFRAATANEPADILYADEAIVDEDMTAVISIATRGRFDIRHYLSHPYIVHPIFIRRSLALDAGLLNETMRISHDVEFFLRCIAKARSVVQIPLVLYFWRTHAASLGHVGSSQVLGNTRAAVVAYLRQTRDWTSFEVEPGVNFNELDVRPPLPASAKAAIVIPTKNGKEILSACVRSIVERAAKNRISADIHVIDHESTDPATLAYLEEQEGAGHIRVVPHSGPWNYPEINNAALRRILPGSHYTHIVFMNNDIEIVTDDWLDRMIEQFSWGDVGVVGCCLQYPDGRVQHGGVVVGLTGAADHSHRFEELMQPGGDIRSPGHLSSLVATRDYSAVTAALMIVPVSLFEAVGGFDEQLAVGFNDTDLCLRIGELGYHSTYVGSVLAVHYESVTRTDAKSLDHPEDTALFENRYRDLIDNSDPYYGMQWDWTGTKLVVAAKPTKAFRLRKVQIRV